MQETQEAVKFDYGVCTLDHIQVVPDPINPGTEKKPRYRLNVTNTEGREYNMVRPTERFWTSLTSRYSGYGVSTKLFDSGLFTHEEVFERLQGLAVRNERNQFTISHDPDGQLSMLAMVDPGKAIAKYDDVMELLFKNKKDEDEGPPQLLQGRGANVSGIVQSVHTPSLGEMFEIGGDKFKPRFNFEVPIDGYGKPVTYLSLLRLVCTNGAIGMAPAFKSEISIGKNSTNVIPAVQRALESFNNEDGFIALQQRLESAQGSWASIAEAQRLEKVMAQIMSQGGLRRAGTPTYKGAIDDRSGLELAESFKKDGWSDEAIAKHVSWIVGGHIGKAFDHMTGDIPSMYGVASKDTLSKQKMGRLAVRCTVYDLFNFATEVGSHYVVDAAQRAGLHSFVGQLLGSGEEFDLEGSRTQTPDFRDMFIGSLLPESTRLPTTSPVNLAELN